MKYIVFIATIFLCAYLQAGEKGQKACFGVEGMTCATCSLTLKAGVKKLKGIASVEASVEKKDAVVNFDPTKTNAAAIQKKIDSIGYNSTVKKCSKSKG